MESTSCAEIPSISESWESSCRITTQILEASPACFIFLLLIPSRDKEVICWCAEAEKFSFWKSAPKEVASFPDHPLPAPTKSHSSVLVFLIEPCNTAKLVNAFWADTQHIGSHLHLEQLWMLKHTSRWLMLVSEALGQCFIIGPPPKSFHTNTEKQDVPFRPHPAFFTCQAFSCEKRLFNLQTQEPPFPGVSTEKADLYLAISSLFIWH